MSTPIITKLHNLAVVARDHAEEALHTYQPKLEAAAHDIETALEKWLGYVDDHLADWTNEAIVTAKRDAFDAYRATQAKARELIDEFEQHV